MVGNKWMRLLTLFLVLTIAGVLMVACDGNNNDLDDLDEGIEDEAGVIDDGVGADFATYDADNNAFVDENEFNTFLNDNELGYTTDDAALFGQYDQDSDSLLNENEFNTMVGDSPLD